MKTFVRLLACLPHRLAAMLLAGHKLGEFRGYERRALRFWLGRFHVACWPYILHPTEDTWMLAKPKEYSEPDYRLLLHELRHLKQQERDSSWWWLPRYGAEWLYGFLVRPSTRFDWRAAYLAISYEVDAREFANFNLGQAVVDGVRAQSRSWARDRDL